MSSPISDLSYRSYGGPIADSDGGWWPIARNLFLTNMKKRGLWWLLLTSAWPYLMILVVVYIFEQIAATAQSMTGGSGERAFNFLNSIVWKDLLVTGLSFGQIFFVFFALMCGAGVIANDVRANALLVYFSKPCTKFDYVFGKWLGVFLSLLLVISIPPLVFCLYGLASYTEYGFLKQDPWMIPKMLLVLPLTAAFYASIVVGLSSLFNQGRTAGVTLCAVYFLTNFFTGIVGAIIVSQKLFNNASGKIQPAWAMLTGYYGSIDGIGIALVKGFLGSTGGTGFRFNAPGGPDPNEFAIPDLGVVQPVVMLLLVSGLMLAIAYRRVRAVEVIG